MIFKPQINNLHTVRADCTTDQLIHVFGGFEPLPICSKILNHSLEPYSGDFLIFYLCEHFDQSMHMKVWVYPLLTPYWFDVNKHNHCAISNVSAKESRKGMLHLGTQQNEVDCQQTLLSSSRGWKISVARCILINDSKTGLPHCKVISWKLLTDHWINCL